MKRITWFLISFCTAAVILGQTGNNMQYLQWMAEAQRLYDLDEPTEESDNTSLNLFLKAAETAHSMGDYLKAADCYIKVGNIHQTYQRFEESNKNYHQSLFINRQKGNDSRINYEVNLYMGSSFYFSNIIDSAQYYLEQASAIASTHKDKKLPEEERLYNSLGAIYFESANYLQAKNYFEKALLLAKPEEDDYEESYVGISSNIANCLMRVNQFDSALNIYRKLRSYEMQPEVSDVINQNTAHTYFEIGHYDSALVIYKNLSLTNDLNRIKALNDIGRIYMNRKQWQQSEAIFDSAIAFNKKISSTIKNKEEALAYLYRGLLASRQGLTDEALTWCSEALQEVHLNFSWKSVEDLPADITQTVSPLTLFQILRTKALLLNEKYYNTKRNHYLNSSLKFYRKAIETANYIKLNFDNDEAKLFFNENYQAIYGEAIATAFSKQENTKDGIDDFIFILENYKGNILHQNLQNVLLKSSAQVPESIKKREKELKQLLAFYTSRINNNATEPDARQLQKRLAELQVELSRLQKHYEKDETYNLYKYRSLQENINLEKAQSSINGNTAIINYFNADTAIYLLAINKNKASLTRVKKDSLFTQSFSSFLNEIYKHTEGNRYEGRKASSELYQLLIEPAASILNKCERWVIIPDGILYYLPMEGLASDSLSRKYVIEDHTISYHYSLSLLFQRDTHLNEKSERKTVAFAPYTSVTDNFDHAGLASLPYSKNEVMRFSSNSYLAENATKKKFLEVASNFPFVHLATHASAGTDSTGNWIQFYPSDSNTLNNKLYLNEIYNLNLHQAELVILSACETGTGNIASGEGLISLSRAFLYAGSDGIISTLWKSEDQVSAFLMQRLHDHLDQLNTPEKALQLAKIDLLRDKNISSKYKTPNYWSNFIYVGKVNMQEKTDNRFWWLTVAGAGLLGYLFIRRKKIWNL